MSSGILVSIVFVACAAGAACTSNSTPAAATPAAHDVVAADAAWTAALAGRDASATSALDAEFEWTNSQGRTYTRGETLQHLPALAADLGGETNVQHYGYGHIHVVTSAREGARMMRVWALRPEGWRALGAITTTLATGTTPFAATGGASGDCDNPCRTMPLPRRRRMRGRSRQTFMRLKMDEWHPDPDDWSPYVLDDVYLRNGDRAR